MKFKSVFWVMLIVGLACDRSEDVEAIPIIGRVIGQVSIIDTTLTIPIPTVDPASIEATIDLETKSETVWSYGLSIDTDRLRPMLEKVKKTRIVKYADIHIVIDGKDYMFTLDEFLKRIEQ